MPTVAANFRKLIQQPASKASSNVQAKQQGQENESKYFFVEDDISTRYNNKTYSSNELQGAKKQIHDRNPIAKLFLKFKSLFTKGSWNQIVNKKSQIKSENCIAAGEQAFEIGCLITNAKKNNDVGEKAKIAIGNLIGGTGTNGNNKELQHYEMKDEQPIVYREKATTDKKGNITKEWTSEPITEEEGWTGGTKERYILPQTQEKNKIVNIIEVVKEQGEYQNLVTSYKLYMTTKEGDNIKPIKESKCILNSKLSEEETMQSLDYIDLAIKAEKQNLERFSYPNNNIHPDVAQLNHIESRMGESDTVANHVTQHKPNLATVANDYKNNFTQNSKPTSTKPLDINKIIEKDFHRDISCYPKEKQLSLQTAKDNFLADQKDNNTVFTLIAIGQEHLNATQDLSSLISNNILANPIKKNYDFSITDTGFKFKAIVDYESISDENFKFQTIREYDVTVDAKNMDISNIYLTNYSIGQSHMNSYVESIIDEGKT